jgi:anti-sigma regulatory factor (Ser/Thr protein kinase)
MRLTLAADDREYPRLREFMDSACQQAGCSPGQRTRVQLVVEELFSNTVKYGRRGAAPASVTVTVDFEGRHPMTVHYEDGRAGARRLQPSETDDDFKRTVTSRRVGGLGIVLVGNWAQDGLLVVRRQEPRHVLGRTRHSVAQEAGHVVEPVSTIAAAVTAD